jgi:AAA+ ATPase superfamily predicted ATPase
MLFVNREYELDFLNEKWGKPGSQLIVIYGKRRVGKTELAVQFAKDKPHLYFLCEKVSAPQQLAKFTEAVRAFFKDEFLPEPGFKNWETALKYLAQRKSKVVLIIDEFPYLVETDPSAPSTFQKAWDLYLKDSQVYLILSGSSISMMERATLYYRAPLYGRRTGQLLIKPFRFRELVKLIPKADFETRLAIYGVVGGTPPYLNKFRGRDFMDVVKTEILRKGESLYEEVEFLLREELKEPRNYFVILEALSLGKHKLSELINATGLDKGVVSRYLSILEGLGITKKEIPVTEKIPEKSRRGIYRIEDNFFNFWFRFVFRNRSLLEENKVDEAASMIRAALPELLSRNYKRVAPEILSDTLLAKKLPLSFDILGRWWDRNEEIDLVAWNRMTQEILFGEVKWSNKPVGTNIYEELKEKAHQVEWGKKSRKEYFALFSKSGFTSEMIKKAREEKVFLFHRDRPFL